jgi:hypothetical protein
MAMKKVTKTLSAFLLIIATNIIFLQAARPSLPSGEANDKTVVEFDSIMIITSGKKAGLIQFDFKRKLRVRINTDKGLKAFSYVSLPQTFDPILYCHAPLSRNVGKHLTNINVQAFNVRIIKPDGSTLSPDITPDMNTFRAIDIKEDKFGEFQEYGYHIPGLENGDVLEYEYDYSVKYGENLFSLMTLRIFFHGDFPIKRKEFSFIIDKGLESEIHAFFCDEPEPVRGQQLMYSWHFSDLEACMDESGSRAYKTLPHVIISLRPYEMIYSPYNSFEERFAPFYFFGVSVREAEHLAIVKAMLEGVNTPQYNQIRRYIDERLANLPDDTSGYSQLYTVHNYIADHFTFDPDLDYYNRLDIRKERFGDDITAGVITDRSRYNLYVGLIAGLGLNYFTAYLSDVRSGVISEAYFEPTISNDYIFAVMLKNASIQFIYPKKDRFGYFLNELPFYFENTTARLIYLDYYRDYKSAIEEKFVSATTPASNNRDNSRTQSAVVNIDLENMAVDFTANVILTGQYSTLGRSSYLYDLCDETVNPLYCHKIWEGICREESPDKMEVKGIQQDFPFKAEFDVRFRAGDILTERNDTLYLDLRNWFCHIVDDHLHAEKRVLPYYPDFRYADAYNYKIVFSDKVKLIDKIPVIDIKNAYGNMGVRCFQMIDGSVLFNSRIDVLAEKVYPDGIDMVKAIQDQARVLGDLVLRFVVTE